MDSAQYGENVEVKAYGFVSNMHEFMGACDAIITKAGAVTSRLRAPGHLHGTAT